MNRKLKFRIWGERDKKFSYLDLNGLIGFSGQFKMADDITIQQYTGLKDNNDKEIYEGDIIKWSITHQSKTYKNQNSVLDFSNPILSEPQTTIHHGEVMFDYITDRDDFYTPEMLAWGLRTKRYITSLPGIMKLHVGVDCSGSNHNIKYDQYELVGNIFENPELLK